MVTNDIDKYLHKRTIIAGDVNSGKTTRTTAILNKFIAAGYGPQIAVLDLAPDLVGNIGGKLPLDLDTPVLYLTEKIIAPRLMGKNTEHTIQLAKENAEKIERLFTELKKQKRDILFVNDATLYLQSGDMGLFLETLRFWPTCIINIYYGNTFKDSELTRRERELSDKLIEDCEEVILL